MVNNGWVKLTGFVLQGCLTDKASVTAYGDNAVSLTKLAATLVTLSSAILWSSIYNCLHAGNILAVTHRSDENAVKCFESHLVALLVSRDGPPVSACPHDLKPLVSACANVRSQTSS